MKHSLFICLAVCATFFTACNSSSPYQLIAEGQPIKPIRLTQDSTTIFLTDYVPLLAADSLVPEIQTLVDNGEIQLLCYGDMDHTFSFLALPHKPFSTGVYTTACTNHSVTIHLPDDAVQLVALVQNIPISEHYIVRSGNEVTITIAPVLNGRSYLRVFAVGTEKVYNDVLVPLENGRPITQASQLNRHDNEAQVLYSLMIDRFSNGTATNDWKMNSSEVLDIVDYQGGDFLGITQKIESGFFDSLGVNTLWLSPITQNPWDAWGCYPFPNGNKYDSMRTYTKFSGYHGYWPIYTTSIEKRFGTSVELKRLLAAAHRHNINVILDYVANHMHINSPTYKEHPTWHTDSILSDGRRNFELWDECRLTTWFDVHIPTLDLERKEVCEAMTDSALYWLANYDFDGFRHDACKHIPERYWRLLVQKMNKRFHNRPLWMIGETYGDTQLIGSYIKTGMLNAQFDFNLYFTLTKTLCSGGSMTDVASIIGQSLSAYGAHHTMGNISGNHDQIRFASLAGGAIQSSDNGKEEGWNRQVGIGDSINGYKRALLLEVINLTLPGVPCIYQGDEYAEVGGNDPDNRHMMRFDEQLNEVELAFKAEVTNLIRLRRTSMPLLYGDYELIEATDHILCFDRVYMGERIRVTIDNKNLAYTISPFVTPRLHPDYAFDATIYELNIRQATPEGTFLAAENLLPELKENGIDIIWVMPIQPIGIVARKGTLGSYYSILDYCNFNPEFGTRTDFEHFLNAAHEQGFKVILDWVANHTAPDSEWTKNEGWHYRDAKGNLMVQYDWTDISKLNYNNYAMRHEMLGAMCWWLDSIGIDGFRCDVAGEVPIDFWNWAMNKLRIIHPDIFTLAEDEDKANDLTESAFDMYYGWTLHRLMNEVAQGKSGVEDLWAYFAKADSTIRSNAIRMNFITNHDENSWAGTVQERMGDAADLFAAFTYVVPGMPLIYTGQISGNHHRLAFFEKDMIDVAPNAPQRKLYYCLNMMRRSNPALWSQPKGADMHRLPTENKSIFACVRNLKEDGNTVIAVMNMSSTPQTITLSLDGYEGVYRCLCGKEHFLDTTTVFALPAWGYKILAK